MFIYIISFFFILNIILIGIFFVIKKHINNIFDSLYLKFLQQNNDHIIKMINDSFKYFQEKNKFELDKTENDIKSLINPIKNSLNKIDTIFREIEKERNQTYGTLMEKIQTLIYNQKNIEKETSKLVKSLRAPQVRGRWGEIQLKKTVEIAGLLNYVDFIEQKSTKTEEGIQRPDMIIELPNNKKIIVDAKVPLHAYLDTLDMPDYEYDKIKQKLKEHTTHIKNHILKLSSKKYWEQFNNTPEFVILFLPGEVFFSAALESDPDLINKGIQEKVIIATPTTLIALLKTIYYGWKQENLNKSSQEIASLGQGLYDRIEVFNNHFQDLSKNLENSVQAYNKTIKSMDTRILPILRKFNKLNIKSSKNSKENNDYKSIDVNISKSLFKK